MVPSDNSDQGRDNTASIAKPGFADVDNIILGWQMTDKTDNLLYLEIRFPLLVHIAITLVSKAGSDSCVSQIAVYLHDGRCGGFNTEEVFVTLCGH